jgi:hypothetical protein
MALNSTQTTINAKLSAAGKKGINSGMSPNERGALGSAARKIDGHYNISPSTRSKLSAAGKKGAEKRWGANRYRCTKKA